MEYAVVQLMLLVLHLPAGLKGQGVHEVHDRVGGYLVEYVLYHAVGVFADPGVQITAGFGVKLAREDLCARKGRAVR